MIRLLQIACCCLALAASAQTDRFRLLLSRGELHQKAGRLDEAARDFEAARALAERAGNRSGIAESSVELGYLRYYRGQMNGALVDLLRGYETAGTAGDVKQRQLALEGIAHVYADVRVGQYDRAIEYYLQLLRDHEQADKPEGIADTYFNLGSTHAQKGDQQTALDWFAKALAAEEKLGRQEDAGHVQRSMGVALGKLGRPAEALSRLDAALAIFQKINNQEGAMLVRQSRGIVLRQLGRMDEAIRDLEATRVWFTTSKNTRFLEKSQDELAQAYAGARRWDAAYRARTAHEALERELAVQRRDEHTTLLRIQFDSEKKEQENRALLRERAAASVIRSLQTVILALGGITIAALVFFSLRMRKIAMTDDLTRLPNRRRVLALAERELHRARRNGEVFSLMAMDIDQFKAINDQHGHAAGDLVLQRLAQACRQILGRRAFIGRTGGEEFLIVLPGTRLHLAHVVAERARLEVERLDLSDIDPSLRATVSIGLAESAPADEDLATIVRRADALLYQAKERGRNRVEVMEA